MSYELSSGIWDNFDARTSNGHSPFLFESVLPLDEGFAGPSEVETAFFSLRDPSSRETLDCRARIYVGEDRRDDLVDQVHHYQRLNGEALPTFMTRYTDKDRFSLVINNLEQAASKLAADFGEFAQSFFAARGMPLGGVEQAVFCGNYSGTAFGIHEGFEHALLCHLGPGIKNFYCWTREDYTAVTGATSVLSLAFIPFYFLFADSNLPSATYFEIGLQVLNQGFLTAILGLALFSYGVSRLGAATAGLFSPLMPVFSALFGIPILGESLDLAQWIGVILVAAGLPLPALYLIARRQRSAL